ncbi:MAG: NAD(P)H-dependent oxidoreductase [Ignavibacteriales bacterium]|nr:NAD(P)H-dependent oxidoreductase [Ignavibacteriota bacterium]MCB9248345.1 NAD(P)H-dependent oxidoreductase [Ignavibacteriales bacterium]
MGLHENLNWRYATKKMNGKKVPDEKVEYILEAARLAPTSSGLQPFQIIVVSNQELKEKMKPIAFNQSQITDSSHVLVFAAWDKYTPERINETFANIISQRGLKENAMDDYKNSLISSFGSKSSDDNFNHAAKQTYIALGIALTAAAEQKVDSTPMEGFDPEKMNELLGLKEKRLRSVTLLALGYRDTENDWLVNLKKVRKPKDLIITEIK